MEFTYKHCPCGEIGENGTFKHTKENYIITTSWNSIFPVCDNHLKNYIQSINKESYIIKDMAGVLLA